VAQDEARVIDAAIRANRHRAVVLCLIGGLIPGLVLGAILGALAGPIAGGVALTAVSALVALTIWRRSTAFAVRIIGAHPANPDNHPRLCNLVEGLCATFGLRPPALMVVDDPVPNACALGRRPADAVLVVTSGLLGHFGLIEMEGLVAHELAHVRCHDTAVSSVAVAMLAPWARLTRNDRWLHAALGVGREYRADQIAAGAVRYPPGLHDALVALQGGPAPGPDSLFSPDRLATTRWLWIDPMVGRRHGESGAGEIDATGVRVAALAEL
jgi:Zn-dependent protease with chaperone function